MGVIDKHEHWLEDICFKCQKRIHYPDGVWYRRVRDIELADGCKVRSKQAHRDCSNPIQ